jgi:hypothetical protein
MFTLQTSCKDFWSGRGGGVIITSKNSASIQTRSMPSSAFKLGIAWISTLQIIMDLCIPEIELANTRSQISVIYFQSHS